MRFRHAVFAALSAVACSNNGPPGYPLRADCPEGRPTEGDSCTGSEERYCAYALENDAEDVCFCEDGQWGCYRKPPSGAPWVPPGSGPSPGGSGAPPSAPAPEKPPSPGPSGSTACPEDMQLVDAVHCTELKRKCLRESPSKANNLTICLEFAAEQKCTGKRRRQRFCIDRYEHPSQKGAHPPVMVSAYDAAGLCAEQGKRMCFESEWTSACEGPDELPFPYGRERSSKHCNIDNRYVHPDMDKVNSSDPKVRNPELVRLDQGVKSGAMESCKSGFGVYDLTGNFDEWVRVERKRGIGDWAGLKGGAWGIVRNACRPTTTSHVPHWSYYFISFRCCKDPDGLAAPPDDGIPLWTPPPAPPPKHPAGKPLDRGFTP